MGLALETLIGYNGNLSGSTTFDALTAGVNAGFTVRAIEDGSAAWLEDVWATDDDSAFQLSIKSPRMHDQVKGMLFAGTNLSVAVEQAFVPQPLMPGYSTQRLYSTDVLSVTANGTAADVFLASFNIRYENLGGINARLYSWDQIRPMIVNKVGILTQPAPGGSAGAWGTGVILNAVDNRLHADTDYAVLGYTCSRAVGAVAIQGIDTGNLFVGGPGGPDSRETSDFFIDASVKYGVPHIPVINSNNAGGITVQIADILTSGTPNVTVQLAQLSQKLPSPG